MIINAWLEDPLTLNVQFDRPVTVADGGNVGAWLVDDVGGSFAPTEMTQVDVDVIWLFTASEMTSGTAGYSGGNPGGLTSVDGFPTSDSHAY